MRHFNKWEKFYYSSRARLKIPRADIKENNTRGLQKTLRMWWYGFYSEKAFAFDFNNNSPGDYLTDSQASKARYINETYAEILNNKFIFEKVFSDYVKVPKAYGIIYLKSPRLFSQAGDIEQVAANRLDVTINELCKRYGKIVIKPISGALGKGVFIISRSNSGELVINNKKMSSSDLFKKISPKKEYIISEFIEQGEFSMQLYPLTTNTIRIITMLDPEDQKPFIAASIIRIGTQRSAPVDNNNSGGISAEIDINSGELGELAIFDGSSLTWQNNHPDSDVVIKGLKVPGWHNIKDKVLTLAGSFPFIKYVGWDIVEKNGEIVVLEGNNHPAVRAVQIHKPLLKNPKVKSFFKYHEIL